MPQQPLLLILTNRLKELIGDSTFSFSVLKKLGKESDETLLIVEDLTSGESLSLNTNDYADLKYKTKFSLYGNEDLNFEKFDAEVNDFINRKKIIRQQRLETILKEEL